MYMISHHTPCIYFHPLFLLAISQTIKQYILIFIPCKYIYPFYNGKTYKVDTFRIFKLIISAPICLFISFTAYLNLPATRKDSCGSKGVSYTSLKLALLGVLKKISWCLKSISFFFILAVFSVNRHYYKSQFLQNNMQPDPYSYRIFLILQHYFPL